MKQRKPDFLVLEHITITKDPRTELVVALGGTKRATATSHAPPSRRTP